MITGEKNKASKTTTNKANGTLTDEQLAIIGQQPQSQEFAELSMDDKLKALTLANQALKATAGRIQGQITVGHAKGSDKGTVCVYGLGQFPTTLYAGGWVRLLTPANIRNIFHFIKTNAETSVGWKSEEQKEKTLVEMARLDRIYEQAEKGQSK